MDFEHVERDRSDWQALGSLLREHAYSTDAVRELLGVREPAEAVLADTGRYSLFYAGRLATIDTAVSVLAQLFLMCARVPAAGLDRLDPALTTLLGRLGLVEPVAGDDRLVRGTVALTEYQGHYLLSDRLFENRTRDFVIHQEPYLCMPPHASSLELLSALREPPGGTHSFLDVGCGTGWLSLLLASGYDRVTGFDPSTRAVGFARVNALLNDTGVRYRAATWESFDADAPYDHVAFNTPDDMVAFDFVNHGIDKVLAPTGHAQVWLTCEVTHQDGSFEGTLQRRLRNPEKWRMEVRTHTGSPFSVPGELVKARRLPDRTLLVSDPGEKDAYLRGLVERRVAEVVSATLTIRHR